MDEFDEFSLVTKLQQQKLAHVLISIPGVKELIVEATLLRPLDKICSMSLLKSYNTVSVQQLYMDRTIVCNDEIEHRIFFVRPTIAIARKICEIIRSNADKNYSIIQVDSRKNFFDRELEKNGLHGIVDFYEFNLSLVCLESDLFSLELPQYSPDFFNLYFNAMAKTLWQLQTLYGQIQTTFGIGECYPGINRELKRICAEFGEPSASADQLISHLFVFDRRLDFASVLLTGLTYESILNDVFLYSCGKISFGDSFVQRQQTGGMRPKTSKIYALNNSDPIFSSIRNSHMTAVFPFLSAKAKFIQSSLERISSIKKIDDMKNFISNEFGNLKEQQRQLETHICACEYLLEKMHGSNDHFGIEHAIIAGNFEDEDVFKHLLNMISKKYDSWKILLLASLWSLHRNGISAKFYKQFHETFLHRYGFEQMVVLHGLKANGLLIENNSQRLSLSAISKKTFEHPKTNFNTILQQDKGKMCTPSTILSSVLKGFPLCPKEIDVERRQKKLAEAANEGKISTNELGYVFSDAYIPLISYLVERTVTKGWDEHQLKKVLGEHSIFCTEPNAKPPDNRIQRALLVCFIGGITYAEIASLRCFAQNRDFRLIILTTHIINRVDFIRSFTEL